MKWGQLDVNSYPQLTFVASNGKGDLFYEFSQRTFGHTVGQSGIIGIAQILETAVSLCGTLFDTLKKHTSFSLTDAEKGTTFQALSGLFSRLFIFIKDDAELLMERLMPKPSVALVSVFAVSDFSDQFRTCSS